MIWEIEFPASVHSLCWVCWWGGVHSAARFQTGQNWRPDSENFLCETLITVSLDSRTNWTAHLHTQRAPCRWNCRPNFKRPTSCGQQQQKWATPLKQSVLFGCCGGIKIQGHFSRPKSYTTQQTWMSCFTFSVRWGKLQWITAELSKSNPQKREPRLVFLFGRLSMETTACSVHAFVMWFNFDLYILQGLRWWYKCKSSNEWIHGLFCC